MNMGKLLKYLSVQKQLLIMQKKLLCTILPAICSLLMLTGCTKEETPVFPPSGHIVLITSTFNNNYLYAVDAMHGSLLWRYTFTHPNQPLQSFSSPTVADSLVFIGSHTKRVYAINLFTGIQKWEYQT